VTWTAALAAVVMIGVLVGGLAAAAGPSREIAGGRRPAPVRRGAGRALRNVALSDGEPLDPTFATGSCVAFPPTSGDRDKTVFIDAGHGGLDPGATGITESGQTIHEADETLPVELDAMALLRADGYRVVVSRTGNETVIRPSAADLTGDVFSVQGARDDIAARDVCANLAKADVLVGIYFDAGTSPTDAGSITGYDANRPFSNDNRRLATLVQTDVLAELNAHGWGIPDDGVVPDGTLGGPPLTTSAAAYDHLLLLGPADPGYFSTPSQMPGALIEPLFITDPFEGTIADSTAGHEAIAEGMAKAVEQYFASVSSPGRAG
jgi:N-acetylmuramoyl-L-alanine amidase